MTDLLTPRETCCLFLGGLAVAWLFAWAFGGPADWLAAAPCVMGV